jgi:hypothetical protein
VAHPSDLREGRQPPRPPLAGIRPPLPRRFRHVKSSGVGTAASHLTAFFSASVLILVLLLSGCTHTNQPESAPTTTSTSTALPAHPSTSPAPAQSIQLENDRWMSFGHFLIVNGDNEHDPLSHRGSVKLFHPKYGTVIIDATKLMHGEEVIFERYVSAGTGDAPTIAGIIETKTPSHDLQPAGTTAYAVQIDPATQSIRHKAEIGRYVEGDYHAPPDVLVGSTGSVVAYSSDAQTLVGLDVSTAKQVWTRPGQMIRAVYNAGGAIIQTIGAQLGGIGCHRDAVVDVATGQDVFVADGYDLQPDKTKKCAELSETVFPTAGIVGISADPSNHAGGTNYQSAGAYDFVHKQNLNLDPATKIADERSNLVVVRPNGKDYAIDVRDSVSGKTLYSIDEQKGEALQLHIVSFFNKQLWVKTTDEHLVVDAATGQTASRGWTTYPQQVADDWVLYSDGKFTRVGTAH